MHSPAYTYSPAQLNISGMFEVEACHFEYYVNKDTVLIVPR